MTIKQLEYFLEVANTKSVSAAAKKLNIAQPPLSKQISLLEEELQVSLFIRSNKGMILTEAGRKLKEQGQNILYELNKLPESLKGGSAAVSGTIKVGVLYSTVAYATERIKEYHRHYPQVNLYIRQGTPQDLIEDLNSGELDILFLRGITQGQRRLHEEIIGEDEIKLIMTEETDPAPGEETVDIRLLETKPLCLLRSEDLYGYDEILTQACQRANVKPRIACQCYDTPTVVQMILTGFGMGFLPESVLQTVPGSGLYAKSVKNTPVQSYVLAVWNETGRLSAGLECFIRQTIRKNL